ncbi:type II toxin-antitoxin system RelE/ParE family toxin [Marinoscillum sp.]|uniref:type II toxin-antitoxin system RelE/ParE family toxin n=1 Tax=Marinoscillum sp. TaxID=2024838 RepID=UPI003BA922AC
MVEIRFAESAWDDLDSITDYIAQDSVRYVQEFGNNVFEAIDRLHDFPRSGRIVPEFKNEDLREVIFGKYRCLQNLHR